jgi:hypothetical protein
LNVVKSHDALKLFKANKETVERIVGPRNYWLYVRRIKKTAINMIQIDRSSFILFYHKGEELHISMVSGNPGTLEKIALLRDGLVEFGVKFVYVQTKIRAAERLYRRYGFKTIAHDEKGRAKMVLEV